MENFLSDDQIAKLKKLKFKVSSDGFYIDLYRDEFDEDVWEQVCDQANVKYNIDKLTIFGIGTIKNK
jgi:hypothetical protein